MFRTLDRYIFREMMPPFFLSMAVLLLVLFLQKLFRMSDIVMAKEATLASTVKVLIYVVPSFLVITIPMSLLVAALTAFSRMSADSEITAMKASRISLYLMIRPVFLFALLCFAATAATSLILVPSANTALKAYIFNLVKSHATIGLEPGVFNSTFNGMVMYVDKMDAQDNMEGVFISDERAAAEHYTIVARRGKLTADPRTLNVTLALQEGSIHTAPKNDQSYPLMGFDRARLFIDIKGSLGGKDSPGRSYEDMSVAELRQEIGKARGEGKPAYAQETELHKRLSIPFACLIFGLLGAPLGIRRSRSGKSAGIAIALLVFLIYYIIVGGATNLAETGILPPLLAYWLPNIVIALVSLLFVYKKGHEVSLGLGHTVALRYYQLKERILKKSGAPK
jgi:lipopolysaccharide export system permease protein